ncbi:PQQ-binding-like beta-propeller repeat protein [Micromonospora sp. HK10]|uniref:outer membrane protein assembly factor BamB family protein n=1 Tax=Micromonospora sp. HK10 TaxID=1538294 RepID=UPI000626F5CB|nr:PQQ-binding-like beta-propeller repeat protein [Micromonospora sp. HK10]
MSRVIELGELPHGGEARPVAEPPRPPARLIRMALLGCLALVTLAGAAPLAHRPAGVLVPAPQSASFVVVAGRLVVADGPGTVGRGGRAVTGHRLPGGETAWQFLLPAGDHVLGLSTVAGLLLVTSSPTGAGDTRSTALDPASGTVRWQHTGYPVPTQEGGVLFETPRADGSGTLRAVDPASGAARWSLPLPGNGVAYRTGDRGVREVVLVTADGRVEVHDADSGALRHTGRVPPAADGVSYRFTQVVADLLLVDAEPDRVAAYDLAGLRRRWSVPVPARGAGWFADCAGVICLHRQAAGVGVFDPATGRQLWTDERWLRVNPIGARLLAAAPGFGSEEELVTLDPATGRVLARFGRWRLSGTDRLAARQLGFRRLPDDRMLVAELDVPAGRIRFRAVLVGTWDDCADAGRALVCLRPSGGLVVWPVDP